MDTQKQATLTLSTKENEFAEKLFNAYQSHKALKESDWQNVVTDEATAYNVQKRFTELKGEDVGGYKVSLTSKQTQDMFDSDSPLYGAQVKSHFVQSPVTLHRQELMEPLAEVEMLFTAKEALSSSDSLEDLLKKTKVAPAVEVPDSRFSDWFPSLSKYMVMADAAVGGFVVYGQEVDATRLFDSVDDLANVKCQLFHNGKKLKDGASSEVLGNPLNSLQWLVKKLEDQGQPLQAGQRVSSGTFLLPESLTDGEWKATFDQGLGAVFLNVAKD
ncbi:2-keto-4-pentenoate hydratase [Lentilactobacillus farraginis DSM 18382 = JCM 14108]|uniref:2-keto-4-pentenoate hydratase n=2 Tax=Lentilactobacillus farraginis TaxID=390841 RepID=X0PLZ4_9LACO|nr:2-keto-4-pentenoate hydratase [Lentilactobacillus farraginis DSM 18382 = JCM 14108]GAF37841.1 2-oxo-hepta-3-ene-1,7-dioate hydratase [Lentilactobacillus farraginis DSM 18382 = JCM 14108]